MKLTNLELTNYRNCENVIFDFEKNKTLIIGKNAQGKTNILESIYFLSGLKSPRTSNNTELIKFDQNSFCIKAQILKNKTQIDLSCRYDINKKREICLNGVKTTANNFKNTVKCVLFSSSDLLLLRGTPQDRRNWLDMAISQIYPAYDDRLSKYEKIRIQKNNYFKECAKTGKYDESLLDVLNEQLSVSGSNIIYIRKKYLNEIEKIAQQKHKTISETEELSVKYDCNFLDDDSIKDIADIQTVFKSALEERKAEEIRRCQACVGPHRDDIIFSINGLDGTKFASQGQQRTIVLALKLSELDIITEKTGDEPLLLLDDVLAELDDIRQNYLLKSISKNTQTIITSVDTILFENEFLNDVQIYKIDKGEIKK